MKKLSIILAVIQFILAVKITFAQWQTYQVTSVIRFWDVNVVAPELIWACGDSSVVMRSSNGGQNWQMVNSGLSGLDFVQMFALDENRAWVSAGMRLFATTNGGANWNEQFFTPTKYVNRIHFFNSSTGFLLADQNDSIVGYFVTRNGGMNWDRPTSAPVIGSFPNCWISDNGANCLDSNFIWFVVKGAPNVYSRFFKLSGGLNGTWQSYNIGITPGQYSYASFKNALTGLVVSVPGKILKTVNGGINWQFLSDNPLQNVHRDLTIIPGTDWVLLNTITEISMSFDLGITWPVVNDYVRMNYNDAKDTTSIWISGNNGQLLKYNFNYIGINPIGTQIPLDFMLYQNYPNPFNPSTEIKIDLPRSGNLKFEVFDLLGKTVYEFNEFRPAGTYVLTFGPGKLSSGLYFYRIQSGANSITRKMILLK